MSSVIPLSPASHYNRAMKALIKTANERAPRLKGPQPSAEDRKLRAAARPPHARLIAATWPLLLAPHRLSAAVSQTAVQCPVPSARLRLPSSQSPAVGRPGVDVSLPPGAPQDSGEKRSRGDRARLERPAAHLDQRRLNVSFFAYTLSFF